MPIQRSTHTLRAVLGVLLERPDADHYGTELAKQARINHGSVYPVLIRLESYGWLTSHWELIDESLEGRRRRKYFRLTGLGQSAAAAELRAWDERFAPGKLNLGHSTA